MQARSPPKSSAAAPETVVPRAPASKGEPDVPARIETNPTTGRPRYNVIANPDETKDRDVMLKLRGGLLRTMPVEPQATTAQDALAAAVEDTATRLRIELPAAQRKRVLALFRRDFLGYGKIDVPMRDPAVEDISCDGPGIPVYVFHREHGSIETNIIFEDDKELDEFVIRLAQMANREITFARPMLEATLPDKSRLQATLAREITTRGSSFTIRRFRPDPMTPIDLIKSGTMDARLAAFLWLAIEQRTSALFAGGTASGKTTALNALCVFIPPDFKVVSIEDTRELNLPQQNWIAGLTRAPSGADGRDVSQRIDMYKLLESALRQRPDYIIVGEVRGPEAVTLFQAMATGHATYSTIHADSPLTVVRRLENPPIGVPRNLIESLGLIIMAGRAGATSPSSRRLLEVSEIAGVDEASGDLLSRVVFRWDPQTDSHEYLGQSRILDRMIGTRFPDGEALQAEWDRRTVALESLAKSARLDIRKLMDTLTADKPATVAKTTSRKPRGA